jgi:hypothetical protein
MGSYITYLKRYSYAALVGIATDDDDGEQAMQTYRGGAQPVASVECITQDQLNQLEHELKGHPDIAKDMIAKMRLQSLKDMPKTRFMSAVDRIREIKELKR